MQKLYHIAGVEGKAVVFLLTDTQISKESFLEDVNNLLNSGEVPGMYAPEDKDRIISSVSDWLATQGAPTSKVHTHIWASTTQPLPTLCMAKHAATITVLFCHVMLLQMQYSSVMSRGSADAKL